MENTPIISVIVPCYNQSLYIKDCLLSVKKQSYENWECVIVDDGSTDESVAIIEDFIKNEPRFNLIMQQNMGVCIARNNAINKSKGKYILPLDGDDVIGETYLEKGVNCFENNTELSAVYCKAKLFGNRNENWEFPDYSFKLLLQQNILFSSTIFKKSDYNKIQGFDPKMKKGLEDWEFWISLLNSESKVYRLNDVLFFYRIIDNSRNSSYTENEETEIRRYIYDKHKVLYDSFFKISDLLQNIYLIDSENNQLKKSKEYLIGSFLIAPLKRLKKILK